MARLPEHRPLLYYITDRKALHGRDLLAVIGSAVAAGLDLIQIRERNLSTRDLLALVEAALERAQGSGTRILVNDRLDVALAAGSGGVHLPTHGLPVADVRQHYPELLIGASTHNLDELQRAEEGGADFVVFGPVYETPSKKQYGAPVGVEALREAAQAARIPVLAIGGVTAEKAAECLAAGAAGLAAIRLFQAADELTRLVSRLRGSAAGE